MSVQYFCSRSTRTAMHSASGKISQSRTCCSRSAPAVHNPSSRRSKANCVKRRAFSTNSASSTTGTSDSPIRISHVLIALVVLGVGATSWGLYEFYMTLTMWPNEVRGDLRAGLRAKQRGDLKLSQRHLSRAWETIQNMPPELLSPDPYLKYSGVAIVLAEVLEADKQLEEAYNVLKKAAIYFIDDGKPASPTPSISPSVSSESSSSSSSSRSAPSPRRVSLSTLLDSWRYNTADAKLDIRPRMRAVALALKLGDMAETLSKPEEEERWLEFSVAEVLRIIRDEYNLVHDSRRGFVPVGNKDASAKSKDRDISGKNNTINVGQGDAHAVRDILSPDAEDAELGLPTWVSLTKTELAAPMERLGAYYARQGRTVNAILLYRVASSLLVHPKTKSPSSNPLSRSSAPSVTELCQALQIESAHMTLLMDLRRARPGDEAVQRDLPRVLTRAVQIYDEAVRKHGQGQPRDDNVAADSEIALCDQAYPAVLYNAGVYYEEEGQLEQALRSYSLAYMALRTHGSREMMQDALENARRLQRIVDKNARRAASQPTA